jgi:oxygen-independent coproporphyrinogen-3 oxidase
MDTALLATYDRPVPRYTSYPTAAQFNGQVGPAEHSAWLGELDGDSAAFYLHVPFCRELCWYCACHTMAMRRPNTLEAYARALERELEGVARAAPGMLVSAIQWGGGTPGQLGADRLRVVGRRITSLFDRCSAAETSLEIDPRHCDSDLATAIAELGVTRVSLGVQDFDPVVQRVINRQQSFATTCAAIEVLRAAGIRRFNIDLVYGLPRQTLESLENTLDLSLQLRPGRFAVFGYAHVPWMKPHQKLIDADALPDAALRAAMAELVAGRLGSAGYVRIGLDHYARPEDQLALAAASGRLRRNFQGYVEQAAPWVVGVGASAISSLPHGFSQNAADPARYMARMEAASFATERGIATTPDDRLRADIIEALMCHNRVELAGLCRRHGVDADAFIAGVGALAGLERDGLVSRDGLALTVTEPGRPLVRFICAAFDRHYTAAANRHAHGI